MNGGFFEGGGEEGTNSELLYPIRLYMISGRRGGGDVRFLIIFRSSPATLLDGMALRYR